MYHLSRFDSVRTFVQSEVVYIDYRVNKERTRFSTKVKYTKTAMKSVERNKYELANEHYEKILDNKNIVLFKDISILAVEETKGTVTDYTYKDNMKSVIAYLNPYFGDMDITKIKAIYIENFKKNFMIIRANDIKRNNLRQNPNKLSQSCYNKTHGVLNKIFDYAILKGYIDINPMASIKRISKIFAKPIASNTKYYSKEEVDKILYSQNDNLFLSTLMFGYFSTGVRVREMLELTWKMVNFKDNEITFTVFKKLNGAISNAEKDTRIIPLANKFKDKLLEWRDINKYDLVFPNMKYGSLIQNHHHYIIEKQLKPYLKVIGVPYKTLKSCRTSVASIAVEQGMPIVFVQKLLSHSEISTTQRFYIKSGLVDKNMMKEYVEGLI